jgi:hypothetical protein
MVDDFPRRVAELRFVEDVEKVEHVPYPTGDEFWVRFNHSLDMKKLKDITKKNGWVMVKFGGLPSKLPRPLAEVFWDGVSYVITKRIGGWAKFTAALGFEPDGVAKIVNDAHGPYQIFIATQEEGVRILYGYLGLKYTPPAPPPKPVAPPKPPVTASVKPTPQAPKPTGPPTANTAQPISPVLISPPKSPEENPTP